MNKVYKRLNKLIVCCLCVILVNASFTRVDAAAHVHRTDESIFIEYDSPYRIVSANAKSYLYDIGGDNSSYFHVEAGQEMWLYINFEVPYDWAKHESGAYTGELLLKTKSGEFVSVPITYDSGAWYVDTPVFETMDFVIVMIPDGKLSVMNYSVTHFDI